MKYIAIALILVLTACGSTNPPKKMTGTKIKANVIEYREMCEREPESVLCKVEEAE